MYVITKLKHILKELQEYSFIVQALSIARTISIVSLTTIIILKDIWEESQLCLHKIQEVIASCIHSIL